MMPPPLQLTPDAVHAAGDEWGFNCGPGALCGVLGLTPDEVRPHMGDFERKHYSNPMLVWSALRSLRVPVRVVWQNGAALTAPPENVRYPHLGLVRVQWAGSWCDAGVPMVARYRRTHWIGVSHDGDGKRMVLDVNAVAFGFGWIPWVQWTDWLVPWLIRECVKGGTGAWWPTHCWEVF